MIIPPPAQPAVLAYLYAPGCHACREAKPEWFRYKAGLAPGGLLLVEVDLTAVDFPAVGKKKWSPDATPSYFLRLGSRAFVYQGSMTAEALAAWANERVERVAAGR